MRCRGTDEPLNRRYRRSPRLNIRYARGRDRKKLGTAHLERDHGIRTPTNIVVSTRFTNIKGRSLESWRP